MFFLICYLGINVALTVVSGLDMPSFRPSFRFFHWSQSLLGTLMCLFIMAMTDIVYTIGVLGLSLPAPAAAAGHRLLRERSDRVQPLRGKPYTLNPKPFLKQNDSRQACARCCTSTSRAPPCRSGRATTPRAR